MLWLITAAEANVEATCLKISCVRGRRDLAISTLAGEPGFDVIFLDRRRSEIASRDVDHAVRQAELLDKPFLNREQPLVLFA